jgi:hypothetical protein
VRLQGAADGLQLPDEALPRLGILGREREHSTHEPRDDVGAERETRRCFPVVLSLTPGTLEERRMD